MADDNTALITAGAGVAGQAINAWSAANANKKQRQWATDMYNKQKQDNLDFWNMQNSYNDPQAAMQRFQKAGLSPNLIYGNGAQSGNAGSLEAPHAQPYNPSVPKVDLPAVADSYFNIQSQQQRLANDKAVGNNLILQNQLMSEDLTRKKLDNTFGQSTFDSRVRGFLGENEGKYSNAVTSFLNRDLMEYLAGKSVNIGNGKTNYTQIGNDGDDYLTKDWMLKHSGWKARNELTNSQTKGQDTQNKINEIKKQFTKRTMSGEFKDMSASDIIRFLIQAIK